MPKLKINDIEVTVKKNTTIIEAAKQINVEIPTLCYLKGYDYFTSCMMCVVVDKKTSKLIPACSISAEEGMEIETESSRITRARKDTMDMLLSEHVGDCEAMCTRTCPANMNIPLMIRQIQKKKFDEAIVTVKKDIALPAILGRICSAPCEKGCIHKLHDSSISICNLKRFVADIDLNKENPYKPIVIQKTDRNIAIVGAGPTGLSAAYYLARAGHNCTLYDNHSKPGGALLYDIPEEKLCKSILRKEIDQILQLGVKFVGEKELGKDFSVKELSEKFSAVVIAVGTIDEKFIDETITKSDKGIIVNKKNFQTELPNVFAGGNSIREGRSAIRSCSHGKIIALNINEYFSKNCTEGFKSKFNSVLGKVKSEEIKEYLKGANNIERQATTNDDGCYAVDEAIKECSRCFHCDCRKIDNCRFRDYAEKFNGDQRKYKLEDRNKFERVMQNNNVIYEPGKCIKCNLCVQITEKAGEEFGLTMVGRGFNIKITTPFNEPISKGLQKTSKECVEACPTAALAWLNENEE